MDRIRKYLFYLGYGSDSYAPTLTGSQEYTCDPTIAWSNGYAGGVSTNQEVYVQAIMLFLASGGSTFLYLLWTDQFGMFTVLLPFLVGGVVTLVAFIAICAMSPGTCVANLLSNVTTWIWCGLRSLIDFPCSPT
jgi:hypothetical protein